MLVFVNVRSFYIDGLKFKSNNEMLIFVNVRSFYINSFHFQNQWDVNFRKHEVGLH